MVSNFSTPKLGHMIWKNTAIILGLIETSVCIWICLGKSDQNIYSLRDQYIETPGREIYDYKLDNQRTKSVGLMTAPCNLPTLWSQSC